MFAACRSDRERWQARHPARPRLGQGWLTAAARSHTCGQRHLLWRGRTSTGRIASNSLSSPLSELSLNRPNSSLILRAGFLAQSSLTLHTPSKEGRAKANQSFTYRHRNTRIPPGLFFVLVWCLVFCGFFLLLFGCFGFFKQTNQPTTTTQLWSSPTAGRGFLACYQGTSPSHHLLRKGLSLQNGARP